MRDPKRSIFFDTRSKIFEIKTFQPEMSEERGSRIFGLLQSDRAIETMSLVFMQLHDHRWLAVCSLVCKQWKTLTNQNIVWRDVCSCLWADKVYVPHEYRDLRDSGRSKDAFTGSVLDSKRTAISADELTTLDFDFRFKRSAGTYWTDRDPFWISNTPLRIKYSMDGSVSGFPWDSLQMRWHFVDERGITCEGRGSFMRVAVNGRCVPTYKVSRHSNWGFILQVPLRAYLTSKRL